MKKIKYETVSKIISIVAFILSASVVISLYKKGLFNDIEKLRSYIDGFGAMGVSVFIGIQACQAIFPFIPGGLGCLAGVILFGKLKGFFYNYLGICLGSMLAFYVGRHCGKDLVDKMFPKKLVAKFSKYLEDENKFTKAFAWLVVLPGAPDDLLCHLAGTTNMTWSTFNLIIFLGKIPSISLYSLGIYYVFEKIIF